MRGFYNLTYSTVSKSEKREQEELSKSAKIMYCANCSEQILIKVIMRLVNLRTVILRLA